MSTLTTESREETHKLSFGAMQYMELIIIYVAAVTYAVVLVGVYTVAEYKRQEHNRIMREVEEILSLSKKK